MNPYIEILIIGITVAVSCALPGVFLILNSMSMMIDSISHTALLGIVLAFFVTGDLSSPYLVLGATFMGLFTVYISETLKNTRLLSEEASIGVVFPLLFSLAIILIARYADSVHIDTDAVLLGELTLAPFDRITINGVDAGPRAMYTSGLTLVINILVIAMLFKELKVSTFDPFFAGVSGLYPGLIRYILMTVVSFTAVSSFESAGSILVIAFMITPGAAAYLITGKLHMMLILSAIFAAISAAAGVALAIALDISIAGSMAVCLGVLFMAVFLFEPKCGFISSIIVRHIQKLRFDEDILLLYIKSNTSIAYEWNVDKMNMRRASKKLMRKGCIIVLNGEMHLTLEGLKRAEIVSRALLPDTGAH